MNSKNYNSNLAQSITALIRLNTKRIKGFTSAYDLMRDNKDLKSIFKERINQSKVFIGDLKNILSQCGKDKMLPDAEVTNDHFIVPASGKNYTILEACEVGEKETVDAYEESLKSMIDAPASMRQKIMEQLNNIRKSHEFIKNFRDFNLDLTG